MNKIRTQKNKAAKNGFTLVELLFACAILGFMLTITLVTFIGVFRFYIWSRTTRTTQEAARQVLNTMTRNIQDRKIYQITGSGQNLCLNSVTPTVNEKSSEIYLDTTTHVVAQQPFADVNCQNSSASPTIISPQSVAITALKFTQVKGPGPSPTTSVVIDMEVTNGVVDTVGPNAGKCRPADNFCDQATFTTAVMQR